MAHIRATTDAEPEAGADERDALFRAAQAGDTRAVDAVLRSLAATVLSTARRILGARLMAEAEDVAQDTLIAVARAMPRIRDEGALPAYAIRTTVRNAIRARQKAMRRVGWDPLVVEQRSDADPEQDTLRRRQADALLALLDELPRAQAEALFLRVALDQSLDEVAQTLGTPKNTVRSRVRLARLAITKKIEKRPAIRALLTK